MRRQKIRIEARPLAGIRTVLFLLGFLLGALLWIPTGYYVASGGSWPTSIAPEPTMKTWVSVETFSGNGNKQTLPFTVTSPQWDIAWQCTGSFAEVNQYNLIVMVHRVRSTDEFNVVNSLCSTVNFHDISQEYATGTFYLEVMSEGPWQLEINQLV